MYLFLLFPVLSLSSECNSSLNHAEAHEWEQDAEAGLQLETARCGCEIASVVLSFSVYRLLLSKVDVGWV